MRKLYYLILIICSVCMVCNGENANYDKLYGFWANEINDASGNQMFVLYFPHSEDGVKCEFHSYFNGLKFSSELGSDINFDGENLSFIANLTANVRYEGRVDSINGMIKGKLIYSDGSGREFNLKKISEEKLTSEFPGLFNLTKDVNLIDFPREANDGWTIGTLAESNIDTTMLHQMIELINLNRFGKVHSILVARNGKLVFEKYFDGFFIDDLNSLKSCTKSITSILIGIALDNGYIKSVEEKILDFFPAYKNLVDKKWQNVELKHILTMSTGIKWERNVHDRIYETSGDVIESTFEQKFSHAPGDIFEYRNPQSDLLGGVIINSTNITVQEFATEYLFKPLQITKSDWPNFKNNNYPLMSGSLALSSRDMLKIGQLVLDKGKWNGKQIVSEKWIMESTSFKIKTDQLFGYGYLWWLGESQTKPGLKVVFATGINGQHIIIFPEINTVVVTTADNMDKEPEFLLKMIDDYIIKGIN